MCTPSVKKRCYSTLSECTSLRDSGTDVADRACLDVLGANDDEGDLAVVQAVVAHAAHEPLLRVASLCHHVIHREASRQKRKKKIVVCFRQGLFYLFYILSLVVYPLSFPISETKMNNIRIRASRIIISVRVVHRDAVKDRTLTRPLPCGAMMTADAPSCRAVLHTTSPTLQLSRFPRVMSRTNLTPMV